MLQRMEDALTSSVNSWWSRGATHLFEEPDTLETPWGYTTYGIRPDEIQAGTPRQKRDVLMGVYAVTGSASGIGHKVAQKLCDADHTVIGVDIKWADIVVDLSTTVTVPMHRVSHYLMRFRHFSASGPTIASN